MAAKQNKMEKDFCVLKIERREKIESEKQQERRRWKFENCFLFFSLSLARMWSGAGGIHLEIREWLMLMHTEAPTEKKTPERNETWFDVRVRVRMRVCGKAGTKAQNKTVKHIKYFANSNTMVDVRYV